MLGANGGLIGGTRTASALGSGVGLWAPNEQAALRRNRSWPLSGDPFYSYTSLLLSMDGTNNSTTFTDSSPYGLTVTANGDAKISTAQSKFGGASAAFDGTGDYLTLPSSSAYDLGANYTIEFWVYPASTPNYNFGLVHRGFYSTATSNWAGLAFSIRCLGAAGSGNIRFYFYATTNANEQVINTTGSLVANTWTHVAMSRSGTTGYAFINGVLAGTITSLNTPAASSETLRIGRWDYSAGNEDFNGYIDDFRITKGVARYTANFTPPTQAHLTYGGYNDPYFPATSLLLHMDGSNNSTAFTDSSLNALTVTANGDAKISTAQSKFGGASAAFDGTGDWLAATLGSAIGAGDFTLEAWIYLNSLAASQPIICLGDNFAATGLLLFINTSGRISAFGGNASIATGATQTIATSTWNHVAISRSGTNIRLFVNGVNDGTATNSANLSVATTQIGRELYNSATGAQLNGYIDDLRITKGVARYTTNFTPTTAPFPDL